MQVGGSIGLFSLMTMVSFCLLAPAALLLEGPVFLPSHVASLGVKDPSALLKSATIAAATFHLYQQVSYMILARVSPVTHSIGNCLKRCALRSPLPSASIIHCRHFWAGCPGPTLPRIDKSSVTAICNIPWICILCAVFCVLAALLSRTRCVCCLVVWHGCQLV